MDYFQTMSVKKGKQFLTEKMVKWLVEKTAIAAKMSDEIMEIGNIGNIAASLAGDTDLTAWPFHFFQEYHISSCLGCLTGCHQAGSTTAYHYYSIHTGLIKN
jgi:hypothetical protein